MPCHQSSVYWLSSTLVYLFVSFKMYAWETMSTDSREV